MTHSPLFSHDVHALMMDGATLRLRLAVPEDAAEVCSFYEGMSAENLRLRFFSTGGLPGLGAAEHMARCGRPGYRALLAFADHRLVGVAEYELDDPRDDSRRAEVALAVADDFHHRGVGTLLLEHLVQAARADGVADFTADALGENHAVLKVFADLGLHIARHFDGPDVSCRIVLAEDGTDLSAVDVRVAAADVASLRPLLRPRSVAVVGAGTRPGSVGRAVLRNIKHGGFAGLLYAVNPHAQNVLQSCRRFGMRLVGPNCLGIANTEEAIGLQATFAAQNPLRGTAGIAVQSGGVGIALLGGWSRLGIGVSSFVSLGDKLDVSSNDLLRWWERDGCTGLALLYFESFGNPRAFSQTARRVARRLPVLPVDAGRSEAGRRAAASHTAAAATSSMRALRERCAGRCTGAAHGQEGRRDGGRHHA